MLSEPRSKKAEIESQTIKDFGEQWVAFPENEGYYGSTEVLSDIFGPLEKVQNLTGKVVADVGCGSGRIVYMLCQIGVKLVYAIDPSQALEMCKRYTSNYGNQVKYIPKRGDEWSEKDVDYVLCIGVLHHIFDPLPVLKTFHANLKPGGKCIAWMYGYEGNELYLKIFEPIRQITTRLPHLVLTAMSWALIPGLKLYAAMCKFLPLPMRVYMRNHIAKLNTVSQKITIYDQLNPTWAKYYKKQEVIDLFEKGGFSNIQLHHRHGYSWTISATKN